MDDDLERLADRQRARLPLAREWWAMAGGRRGARVADVGCGPGVLARQYAEWAGPDGAVLALDKDRAALAFLRARLDPVRDAHVTARFLDAEASPLEDRVDAAFLTDALHHMEDPAAALANLHAPGRVLLLAEFDPEGEGEVGPPRDMRLGPSDLLAMLAEAGWTAGPVLWQAMEHYAVVARG